MINVKTILRKKKLSNGKYPICLRVTKDRKSKYFKTLFDATEAEWDSNAGKFNKRNENFIQNNRLLHKFQDRALKVVGELQIEKEDFGLEEFEKRYRIETNPIKTNVFAFWEEIICEMIEAGRTGNARANRDTYNSLKMFNRSTNLTFKQITPTYLNKYEVFLRSRGGTDGGIGVRMRAIRALYNFGISRNIVKSDFYPFKAYKLSRLKGKGAKRALNFDEVQRIVKMDISNYPTLRNTRNYFVFSFYTRGMNFTDMMKLEWNDIKGDRIFYTRSKTKGNFILKVLPPVQEILNYYKENSIGTKYVFPLLLNENMTPIQIENRKSKTLKKFNKDLKEIARLCKIDKNISSYVARHSFANCLKQKGVATDVISESMGHQNLAITQAYLKELDSSVLDEASELLLV
ncbi:site-specific integrase [Maribacter aurantiacus]|uniref:Site-specific integrase n=1 Tax=Maribacter aurantiacus TaxID=1882343 RepID=A0A5R8MBT1_9FLAO|nr:site-specific integrase [Maribacter aurantiacus]TLF46229.1 site-specific integrase [Maribacter aurantiacus]